MPPEIEHVAVAHSFHRTLIVSAGAPSATPSQDVRFRSKAFALHTPSQFTRQLLTSRLRGRDLKSEEAALLFQVLVAEVRDVTDDEVVSEMASPDLVQTLQNAVDGIVAAEPQTCRSPQCRAGGCAERSARSGRGPWDTTASTAQLWPG
jgi:hypothetical protein